MDEEYLGGIISDAIRSLQDKIEEYAAPPVLVPMLVEIDQQMEGGLVGVRCVALKAEVADGGLVYSYVTKDGDEILAESVGHVWPLGAEGGV